MSDVNETCKRLNDAFQVLYERARKTRTNPLTNFLLSQLSKITGISSEELWMIGEVKDFINRVLKDVTETSKKLEEKAFLVFVKELVDQVNENAREKPQPEYEG